MFMRVFSIEDKAIEFANIVHGILSIRYDWDNMTNKMVKEFVVKY